jgi:mRNA deadenylase 3'-5' endonuclease subunit Ccr4
LKIINKNEKIYEWYNKGSIFSQFMYVEDDSDFEKLNFLEYLNFFKTKIDSIFYTKEEISSEPI